MCVVISSQRIFASVSLGSDFDYSKEAAHLTLAYYSVFWLGFSTLRGAHCTTLSGQDTLLQLLTHSKSLSVPHESLYIPGLHKPAAAGWRECGACAGWRAGNEQDILGAQGSWELGGHQEGTFAEPAPMSFVLP